MEDWKEPHLLRLCSALLCVSGFRRRGGRWEKGERTEGKSAEPGEMCSRGATPAHTWPSQTLPTQTLRGLASALPACAAPANGGRELGVRKREQNRAAHNRHCPRAHQSQCQLFFDSFISFINFSQILQITFKYHNWQLLYSFLDTGDSPQANSAFIL